MTSSDTTTISGERVDLLASLAKARHFLRFTHPRPHRRAGTAADHRQRAHARRADQARPTAVERNWQRFIAEGPSIAPDFNAMTEEDYAEWANGFKLLADETLAGVLAEYEEAAKRTDQLVATFPGPGRVARAAARAVAAAGRVLVPPRRTLLHIAHVRPPSTPATPTSSARPSTGAKSMG